jgi:streptogramin lyase
MADIGGTRRWLEFNTRTEKFSSVLVPTDFKGPISGNFMRVDPNGKMVWSTAGTRIVGLNIETKQFAAYDIPTKNPGAYGMDVAGDGRVWLPNAKPTRWAADPVTERSTSSRPVASTFRAAWGPIGKAISGSVSTGRASS